MQECVDKFGATAWDQYQAAARIHFLCEIGQEIIWEKTQVILIPVDTDYWDVVTVFRAKGFHTRMRVQVVTSKTLLERIREIK